MCQNIPCSLQGTDRATEKLIRDRLTKKYFSPGALLSFALASVLPFLAAQIREVE